MKLKRIDHIGVIVDDLSEARTLLEAQFGLPIVDSIEREDLQATFFKCGDVSIEMIEVTDPELRRARLGDGQRARIEHIAFEVENLEETLRALEVLGVQVTAPPRASGSNLTVWTKAETCDGVMYQFMQKNLKKV